MATLPEDMIAEILLKSRIKSILRFKSVSKSWLSLISSSLFATSYVKQACKHKILLSLRQGFRSLDTEDPTSLPDLNSSELLNISFTASRRLVILGSCNGLLCVSTATYKSITIWNPFTHEYKKTPPFRYEEGWYVARYGFGYDKKSDDYKIFVAIVNRKNFGAPLFSVYSLREDSWSRLTYNEGISCSGWDTRHLGTRAVYLDGALHWIDKNGESLNYKDGLVILSFDLAEDIFKDVLLIPESNYGGIPSLGVVDGVLYSCVSVENGAVTKWTMKRYGMGSSSTRLSLPSGNWNRIGVRLSWSQPLCFTTQGTIILGIRKALVILYERTNSAVAVKCGDQCQLTAYTESLISPNAFSKIQNKRKRKRMHLADTAGKAKSVRSE